MENVFIDIITEKRTLLENRRARNIIEIEELNSKAKFLFSENGELTEGIASIDYTIDIIIKYKI